MGSTSPVQDSSYKREQEEERMPSKNKKKNKTTAAAAPEAPVPASEKFVEKEKENTIIKPTIDGASSDVPPAPVDHCGAADAATVPPIVSKFSESTSPRRPLVKKIAPPPLSPEKSQDQQQSQKSMDMFDPQASTEVGLGPTSSVSPPPPTVDTSETEEQDQAAIERIKLEEKIAMDNEKAHKEEEIRQKKVQEEEAEKKKQALTAAQKEKEEKEKEAAEKEKERVAKEAAEKAKAAEAFAEKTEKEADEAEARLKEAQEKLQSQLKEKEDKTLANRVAAAAAVGKSKAQAAIAKAKEAAQKLKDPKKDPRIGAGAAPSSSSASILTPEKGPVNNGFVSTGSVVKTPYGIGKVTVTRPDGMIVITPSNWRLANNQKPTFYMMTNPPKHTPIAIEIGVGTPADISNNKTAASTPESPANRNCICF